MENFLGVNPKLPMRNPSATQEFYSGKLGFTLIGGYGDYLLFKREGVEIHFFQHNSLIPEENYGQVYIRVREIDSLYKAFLQSGVNIHPNAPLERKPWGQIEFSLLDPDFNLLTFGEVIH